MRRQIQEPFIKRNLYFLILKLPVMGLSHFLFLRALEGQGGFSHALAFRVLSLIFFFPVALRPNVVHGLLILEVLDHTRWRTTVSRTPLNEWSAHRRDLYLTTYNTHNRQTSMPLPSGGIRTHDLSRRAASDLRLRLRGHWDRRIIVNMMV